MAGKPGRSYRGQVVERRRKSGVYFGIRFVVDGKRHYQTLGPAADGWTRKRAEDALQNVLADIRRGKWEERREVPRFHEFASEWLERQKIEGGRRETGLSKAAREDLEWRLSVHLLPWFADKRLDAISVEDVDRYRHAKVRAGKLCAGSINKTLATLAAILEVAEEYGHIKANPASGRRRRLRSVAPRRSSLDRADHIAALLAGAGELDRRATSHPGARRALLATLVFAGLRIGEALSLRWRDIDLARKTITVRAAKTDAGVRTVNVLPVLLDELADYKARIDRPQDALVFGTSTGRRQGATNIRRRILARAVELANEQLAREGAEPMPEGLTPHSLRRTFASLLFANGEQPPYVKRSMGHTSAHLTLSIYASAMDRRDGEPERLKALLNGEDWTPQTHGERPIGTHAGTQDQIASEAPRA
jgi:integrase